MREIKFRAWDKESKRIFNIARFDFADHTVYSHLFACDGYLAENLKIMQYTGLTDKNGTEIYEGDVFHLGDHKITYTVVWHDTGLKGKQDKTYGSFVGLESWQEKIEVIGNIYEHPYLI